MPLHTTLPSLEPTELGDVEWRQKDLSAEGCFIITLSLYYWCAGVASMGFSYAMILVRVAIPSSRRSSQSRDRTHVVCVSCTAGGFFPLGHRGRPKPQFAYL